MEYFELGLQDIERIKPLWEELNRIHLKDSPYFKKFYEKFTFEARIEPFLRMKNEDIKIFCFGESKDLVAYCISTIKEQIGEIESILVSQSVQNQGVGKTLIESSKKWFRDEKCKKVVVSVSYGHDSVFPFYEKLGFKPRVTFFELIDK